MAGATTGNLSRESPTPYRAVAGGTKVFHNPGTLRVCSVCLEPLKHLCCRPSWDGCESSAEAYFRSRVTQSVSKN
jgi:hypothetical protein